MAYEWIENIKIDVHNTNGILVDSTQFRNLIVDTGLNWLANTMRSTTFNPRISYMAWGASSSEALKANKILSTETARKIITSQSSGAVGECITVCYLAPTDANVQIHEFGWFAGTSATAVTDTGCMISRVLYDRLKTNLESVTVTRTDTIIRTTSS